MLEDLYPETPVPLDHETPFQLLVAVLMSAQTTDLKVNQVPPELFNQGPTQENGSLGSVSNPIAHSKLVLHQPKPRTSNVCLNCSLNVTKERFQTHLRISKHCQALDTSFWCRSCSGIGIRIPIDTHIHRLASRWGLNGKNVNRQKRSQSYFSRRGME